MKSRLLIALLFYCSNLFAQDFNINENINTITVKGVTFKKVQDQLVKHGYIISKCDGQSKNIQTRFGRYNLKNDLLNLSIRVHVQDSVAVITGRMCFNLNNVRNGIPDSTNSWSAKFTHGPDKEAFLLMNGFAQSFNKEVIYSRTSQGTN